MMIGQDFKHDFSKHDSDAAKWAPCQPSIYPAVVAAVLVALMVGLLHLTVTPEPAKASSELAYNSAPFVQIGNTARR